MSPGSKIALALFVLGILTYLPYHAFRHDSSQEYLRLAGEVDVMRAGNDQLRQENDDLRRRIDASRSDPRVMERQARERLMLARPDEIILVFPEQDAVGEK